MRSVYFITFILCLLGQTAYANTSLCIEESDQGFNVTPYMSSLDTARSTVHLQDIQTLDQQKQFEPVTQSTFNAGYSSATYLLKFQLDINCVQAVAKKARSLNWWLEIPFSHLDYVTLYAPTDKSHDSVAQAENVYAEPYYLETTLGDRLPFSERIIPNSGLIFPLHLHDLDNLSTDPTFYLKIKSQDSIQVPLFLRTPEAHSAHSPTHTLMTGIYFGILAALVLYNLFIYFSVRNKAYLYYIAYITSFFIVQLCMLGIAQRYFWPESPDWANRSIPFFFMLTFAFGIQFVRSLLHTKEHLPNLDKTLFRVVLLFLFLLPLTTFVHYRTIIHFAVLGAFIFFNLLLYVGVLSAIKQVRAAYFFLTAWITFIITGTIYAMMIIDLLPINSFTLNSYLVGSAVEVILLSLALADRINTIQAEKTALKEQNAAVLRTANEQLELSNKLKDSFMTTVSHEIRTPLNGLIGITELLQDTQLDKQQAHYLDLLSKSGNTLNGLINDVLDFSKIEANQLQLESIKFSVIEMADEVISVFGGTALKKGLKLSCFLSPDVPQIVKGDPTRIKQIVFNLINNAIKFTDQGYVKLYFGWEDDRLLLRVTDSGIGITEEQRKRLFISYSQADPSTTRKYGGTGLGLVICKRLTELMGGVIDIDPSVSKGACFWLELPLQSEQQTISALYQTESSTSWVVEPNNTNFGLHQALRALNIKAEQFNSVDELIEYANAYRICPEHILLDPTVLINSEPTSNHEENLQTLIEGLERISRLPWFNAEQMTLCAPMDMTDEYLKAISSTCPHLKAMCETLLPLPFTPGSFISTLSSHPTKQLDPIQSLSQEQRTKLSALKVMIVEDNDVNHLILKSFLNKLGIEPLSNKNGLEAIQAFKENSQWDLILMDCEMPVMDGFQATREIRQWETDHLLSKHPVKIVAISAHVREEMVEQAKDSGMNDYLAKPITSHRLTTYLLNNL